MNKVSFDGLAIEVTRRCNMIPPCQHCFRGMPQEMDVDLKAVDSLLDQTSGIGDLTFTGGEPLVNLPAIKHIIQYIRDHRITVEYISIVTNGLIYSDEFSNLMIEADDYIREIKASHSSAPNITIGVSRDQYHNNNEGRHFIEKCAEAFKGRNVLIIPQLGGGYPYRMGNAKDLSYFDTRDYKSNTHLAGIEYWKPGRKSACLYFDINAWRGEKNVPIIVCPVYLSATGFLYSSALGESFDYSSIDASEPICNMNTCTDILSEIRTYNKGRKTCKTCAAEMQDSYSLFDVLQKKVDDLLKMMVLLQQPNFDASEDDRILAKRDLEEILSTQRKYNNNLYNAFMIWSDETTIVPSSNRISPYKKSRNEIVMALRE